MTIIPTPWVMALVFVTFLILVYLLNRILYKPLLGFMEARDSSIKKEDIEAIKDVVSEYIPDRICELKNIKTRKAGKMKLIDLTLSVPSDLTIKSGHDICDEIEEHIGNRISNVSVFIHLEPYEAKVVRSSVD